MAEILAGLFGLLIGSFLNVCIHRWPRDESVVSPRSRCVQCERQIAWHDNIPVLSFILLRARCRHCGAAIHWRYPVVELLTAGAFALIASRYGMSLVSAKYCVFAALLIGMIFADFDTLILPDEFTIGGFLIGMAFSFFVPVPDSTLETLCSLAGRQLPARFASPLEAAFGALFPAFTLWFLGWIFEKVRHKEGLGFGDVKMIAAVGAFLGIRGSLFTLIVGSVLGSVIGLAWIKIRKEDAATFQLPFGSFLGIAGLVAVLGTQQSLP